MKTQSSLDWANARCADLPNMVVPAPGPISMEYHDRCCTYQIEQPAGVQKAGAALSFARPGQEILLVA